MIEYHWDTDDREKDDWRLQFVDSVESWFVGEIVNNKLAVLSSVEIETVNRCNNDCPFCPVNRNDDPRSFMSMKDELFFKIIKELKEIDYTGYISLFSNNEPLIDKRIIDWIEYAKKELPNATHAIYTNGILLDSDKYKRITKALDVLIIDNYNDDMVLNGNIAEIKNNSSMVDDKCKTYVWVRKKHQVLENRGGLAPNKPSSIMFHSACALPFFQMVIRPDGKVSRCCQDAYGVDTLGDLRNQTITEVWNGREYMKLRNTIKSSGRANIKMCQFCDQFGLNNYYPVQWEGEYFNRLLKWIHLKNEEGKRIVMDKDSHSKRLLEALRMSEIIIDSVRKIELNSIGDNEVYVFLEYKYDLFRELKNRRLLPIVDYIVVDYCKYLGVRRVSSERFVKEKEKLCLANSDGRLIMVGTGFASNKLIDAYGLQPIMVCDNSPDKCGDLYYGNRIEPATSLNEKNTFGRIVLISTFSFIDVFWQLINQGVEADAIIDGSVLL